MLVLTLAKHWSSGDFHRALNILHIIFLKRLQCFSEGMGALLWVLCPCLLGVSSPQSSRKAALSRQLLRSPGTPSAPLFWPFGSIPKPRRYCTNKGVPLKQFPPELSLQSWHLPPTSLLPPPSPWLFSQPLLGPPAAGEEIAALTDVFISIRIVCKATHVWGSLTEYICPGTCGTAAQRAAASLMVCFEAWRDSDYPQSGVTSFPGISLSREWGGTVAQVWFSRLPRRAPAGWPWRLWVKVAPYGAGNAGTAGCSPSHSSSATPAAPALQGLCDTPPHLGPAAAPASQRFHHISLPHRAAGRSQPFQNKSCTNTAVQLLRVHLSYLQPSSPGYWRSPSVAARGHEGAKKQMSLSCA